MIRRGWILAALLALSPAVSQAALLMLVDGVPGPSTFVGYAGWFSLESMQWNIDRANATPHKLNVTVEVSAGTATLHQAAANGSLLKRIAVDQVATSSESGPVLIARLNCEEPIIRSSSTAHQPADQGIISLDIRCTRLFWEYFDYANGIGKPLTRAGKGSWNFKTNTP